MRTILFFVMIAISLAVSAGEKNDKKQARKEKEKQVTELIESGRYRFVARSAHPMSGPQITLTSEYDLKIDSMQVEAWLPFFGRAYRVDYGDRDGGIKFKEEVEKIDVGYNRRKKLYDIVTVVNTGKDQYTIRLAAGVNGYGNLTVNSINRQSISFFGTIEALK